MELHYQAPYSECVTVIVLRTLIERRVVRNIDTISLLSLRIGQAQAGIVPPFAQIAVRPVLRQSIQGCSVLSIARTKPSLVPKLLDDPQAAKQRQELFPLLGAIATITGHEPANRQIPAQSRHQAGWQFLAGVLR